MCNLQSAINGNRRNNLFVKHVVCPRISNRIVLKSRLSGLLYIYAPVVTV